MNALRQLTVAFAANLCGSSVANLYGECLTTTDSGVCCESLWQFCRESFTVNALRQLTVAFAVNLCGSSVANLIR